MPGISNQEKNNVISHLSQTFPGTQVQYIGERRFVVKEVSNGQIIQIRLFDENLNLIPLENHYNSIFVFTAGVAVVAILENIQIVNDRFTKDRRDGLIDRNGRELLRCIYDSIRPHLDGFVEITLNGIKKSSSVHIITSGNFDWNNANDGISE